MIRKLIGLTLGASLALSGLGVVLAPGAVQAQTASGVLCQIEGSATFIPGLGLGVPPASFGYSFTGTLGTPDSSGKNTLACQGSDPSTPTGASISSSGNGAGGCGYALPYTSSATVTWDDSLQTALDQDTISYQVVAAGSLVLVSGTVSKGTNNAPGAYGNSLDGDSSQTVLQFQTPTPRDCALGGLSTASFQGVSGIGQVSP